MKILFISANESRLTAAPFPLGLASVAGALGDNHDFRVVDCLLADSRQTLAEVIEDFQPELIALSMRNLDNQDSSCQPVFFFPEIRVLIAWLRGQTRVPIVVGGSAFNIVPLELAAYLQPDFGLAGESELSFRALVDSYPQVNLGVNMCRLKAGRQKGR